MPGRWVSFHGQFSVAYGLSSSTTGTLYRRPDRRLWHISPLPIPLATSPAYGGTRTLFATRSNQRQHRRIVRGRLLSGHAERYPRVDLARLPAYDVVVLPDEPYAFAPGDGPEAFPGMEWRCVSGRHLTWYGPSLVEARAVLAKQLGR